MSAVAEQLRNRPMTADPVQFVQDAIAPLFTYNSKHEQATLEEIKEHHVPKYFAPDYTHTFNLTEDADLNCKFAVVLLLDVAGSPTLSAGTCFADASR